MAIRYLSGINVDSNTLFVDDANNRVGIGTAAPSVSLDVQGSVSLKSTFNLTWGGAYGAGTPAISGNYISSFLSFSPAGSSSGETMRITSAGNVGIGTTTPAQKLDVSGNLRVGVGASNDKIELMHGAGASDYGALRFYQAGVERQTIHSFSGAWQSGTIYSASSGAININGWYGVTFGVWYDPDAVINTGGISYFKNNVGIGTTSPSYKLDVSGGNVRVGSNSPLIDFTDQNNANKSWRINGNGADDKLYFQSYNDLFDTGNTRLTIVHSTGNVGIGTTSPDLVATNRKVVSINGTSSSLLEFKTGDAWKAYIFRGSNLELYDQTEIMFSTNGSVRQFISSAGNVGIGTTSPQKLLHVSGGSGNVDNLILESGYVSAGVGVAMQFNRSSGVLARIRGIEEGSWNGGLLFEVRSGSTYPGYDGATDVAMKIATNGNVGIGTTSPSTKLDVSGAINIKSTNTITWGGAYGSGTPAISGNKLSSYLSFFPAGSTSGETMRIDSSGNVGIGTTAPSSKLHISGTTTAITITDTTYGRTSSVGYLDGANLYFANDPASNTLIGAYNGVFLAYGGGNVGIGTTSPSYNLDVFGDSRITSGSLGVGVAPNATDGRIDASNDIVAYSTSDQRLKENVTPIENALEKVKTLTGVEFDWKEETAHVHGYHGHDVGIIAQDVKAVLPEAVRTNDSGYLSVRYEKMIALLIQGMKEQQAEIDELKKLIK